MIQPSISETSEEGFQSILKELSVKAVGVDGHCFNQEQVDNQWIGNTRGATDEGIEAAENKLGVKLPVDYVEFIKITNGFDASTFVEPQFKSIMQIDYLVNTDSVNANSWISLDPILAPYLKDSILVGDYKGEQQFLLIPPTTNWSNWSYWKFANWIPGEEPYADLKSYFLHTLYSIEN